MPSHINDHAPERKTHETLADLHAKVDALAEGQKVLSDMIGRLTESLKPADKSDAAQAQRPDESKPAGGQG